VVEAPDSVDFRDFTGIDVYRMKNATRTGRQAITRAPQRQFVTSIQSSWSRSESQAVRRQFASFDAVFQPTGRGRRPMARSTQDRAIVLRREELGEIHIGLILKAAGRRSAPVAGIAEGVRRHAWTRSPRGRLASASRLKQLGSDAEIVFAEGATRLGDGGARAVADGAARIHKEGARSTRSDVRPDCVRPCRAVAPSPVSSDPHQAAGQGEPSRDLSKSEA
jgi:hypothetical protein